MFCFNNFLVAFAAFMAVINAASFKPGSREHLKRAVKKCVNKSPDKVPIVGSEAELKKPQSTGQLAEASPATKEMSNIMVLLSPAKTLDFIKPVTPSVLSKIPHTSEPVFARKTAQLVKIMQSLSKAQLKKLHGVSDSLASVSYSQFADWSKSESKQAVLAYNGPAFQGLDAESLDAKAWQRLQDRLVIISGLYGAVRGGDKIKPYRLCMGCKLAGPDNEANLYEFWSETLTDYVLKNVRDGGLVVNCASQEYSKAVDFEKLRAAGLQVVDVSFLHCGRTLSVYAKRARGLMVRHIAQQPVCNVKTLQEFSLENYAYSSTKKDTLVFARSCAPPNKSAAAKTKVESGPKPVKSSPVTKRKAKINENEAKINEAKINESKINEVDTKTPNTRKSRRIVK